MKNTLEIKEEVEDDFNTINIETHKEKIMRIIEYQKSLQSSSSSSSASFSSSTKSRRSLLELMKGGNTSLRRLFDMEHTSLSNHFYDYSGSPTFKSIPLWDSDSSEHEFQGSDSWRYINQLPLEQLITINTGSGSDGLSGFFSEGSILVGESDKSTTGKNKKRRRKQSGRLVRTKSFKRLPGFKRFRFRWWRRLKIIICGRIR